MKKIVHSAVGLMAFGLWMSPALGQASPAVIEAPSYQGFELPSVPGNLTYSLSGSELATTGSLAGRSSRFSTLLNGNLGLLTGSTVHPFSMVFSGGGSLGERGSGSYGFENLAVSQQYMMKSWQFLISDNLDYTTDFVPVGLSGVPGAGDVGVPSQGGTGSVLTADGQKRLFNETSGSVTRILNGSTLLAANGDYYLMRNLNNTAGGYDSNSTTGSLSLQRRLDALNQLNVAYNYTKMTYPGTAGSLAVQSATVDVGRQWNRKWHSDVAVGPEFVSGAGINVTLHGAATYSAERGSLTFSGFRGTQTGSGVSRGSRDNTIDASVSHSLSYQWRGSAVIGYRYTEALQVLSPSAANYGGIFSSMQINRAILRHVSAYGSYTVEHQNARSGAASPLALNGTVQTFSFGITYTPMPIHLGGH